MDYWVKYYINGKRLYGSKLDEQRQLISWKKTPLNNMRGVELITDNQTIGIHGVGQFWQYDTYESNFSTGESVLVNRNIQRLIVPEDFLIGFTRDNYVHFLKYGNTGNLFKFDPIVHILPEWYGSWFTWTYNKQTKQLSYSFRKRG